MPNHWMLNVNAGKTVIDIWALLVGEPKHPFIKTQCLVQILQAHFLTAQGNLNHRTHTGDAAHDAKYIDQLRIQLQEISDDIVEAQSLLCKQYIETHCKPVAIAI